MYVISAYALHGALFLSWDAGGNNNLITNPDNWNPDQSPSVNYVLAFSGDQRTDPTLDQNISVAGIVFDQNAASFTLHAQNPNNPRRIETDNQGISNDSSHTQTIHTDIRLSGNDNRSFAANTADLIFSGTVDKRGKALTIEGDANTTFTGRIRGGGVLTKQGTGTLTYSGTTSNTYTGETRVTDGTLNLGKSDGVNAIAGNLVIGTDQGPPNSDVVRLLASNQIRDNKKVEINLTGLLDLNDFDETIGTKNTTDINGGAIQTGTGTLTVGDTINFNGGGLITGNLTLSGGKGTGVNGNTSGSTATISGGRLDLGGNEKNFAIDNNVSVVIDSDVRNGTLRKTNPGTLALNGDNTHGNTRILDGVLQLGHDNALGTGAVELNGSDEIQGIGAARTLSNDLTITGSGDHTFGGTHDLTFNGTTTISGGNRTLVVNNQTELSGPVVEDGQPRSIIKQGTGNLILSGASTFSGGLTVEAGTLTVDNQTGSATGSGTVIVNSGATLAGSGSIAGAVTLNGNISLGSSPGRLISGSQSWNTGGTYSWEINDADQGEAVGHDIIDISDSLDLNASTPDSFRVEIVSLTTDNEPGNVHNFNPNQPYQWRIISTTGGVNSFDASEFELDSSGFSNQTFGGKFTVTLENAGKDVFLNFTPVPEPWEVASVTGLILGVFGLCRRFKHFKRPQVHCSR